MDKLNRIQLKGFKSISNIDLELRPLNLLIGPNGVGKSNFIDCFRFMNKLVQKDLQFFLALKGGADSFLHFGRQMTNAIEIQLLFKSNHYACTLVPDQTGKLLFKEEYCQWFTEQESGPQTLLASRGDQESGLPDNSAAVAKHIASFLSEWPIYHFHDTSETAKVKQSGPIHDNERLRPQAENLASGLPVFDTRYRAIPENCANHSAGCSFFS
jgi:predicted ATPase